LARKYPRAGKCDRAGDHFVQNTIITPEDFPDALINNKTSYTAKTPENNGSEAACKLKKALQEPERDLLVKALESNNWNRNETAESLGINRTTLYKKMMRFGLLKNGGKKLFKNIFVYLIFERGQHYRF